MFAHHMNDGSMFSAFASYSDAGFAAEHDEILLQTPEGNARLCVVAVDVVDSNVERKRLDFATDEELSSWLDELLGRADVASSTVPGQIASRRSAPAATAGGTGMRGR
mgnify:FL=1